MADLVTEVFAGGRLVAPVRQHIDKPFDGGIDWHDEFPPMKDNDVSA